MNEQEQLWVEEARAGDKVAFGRLVEAYQRPVYNLTYRMLGNPQEAFLRAYSRLKQYDPNKKFSTWLFSIANHHCIDRLRKRRTTFVSIDDNPVLQNMEGDLPQPEPVAMTMERNREVQALLLQLDPDYRTPLVLRYWEGYSYDEIAQAMEITVSAVKSRLFRARKQVAELYQQQEAATIPPSSSGRRQAIPQQATMRGDEPPMLRAALAGI